MCSNLLQTTTILPPHSPRQNCPRWFTWEVQLHLSQTMLQSRNLLSMSLYSLSLQFSAALTNFVMPMIDCLHIFFNFYLFLFLFKSPTELCFFIYFFKGICGFFIVFVFYKNHINGFLILFKGKFKSPRITNVILSISITFKHCQLN